MEDKEFDVIESISIPHTIELKEPVTNKKGDIILDNLVLERRPKAKHLKLLLGINMAKPENVGDLMTLAVAKVFSQPVAYIEDLDGEDFFKALGVVMYFLPDGPPTGVQQRESLPE